MGPSTNVYRMSFCRLADNPGLVTDIFKLRKRIFVDQYDWDVPARDGLETDEFDGGQTLYCAQFRNGELIGSFRAIRTDRPYMARDKFPFLAQTTDYPTRVDAYEITRFGVVNSVGQHEDALALYSAMFWFAHTRSAASLVAIADLTYERFLRTLGVRTARYGEPRVVGQTRGGTPIEAVAGEIPIHRQSGSRYQKLLSAIDNAEIDDETLVCGPERISA